jgi:plastocyanin
MTKKAILFDLSTEDSFTYDLLADGSIPAEAIAKRDELRVVFADQKVALATVNAVTQNENKDSVWTLVSDTTKLEVSGDYVVFNPMSGQHESARGSAAVQEKIAAIKAAFAQQIEVMVFDPETVSVGTIPVTEV